jgi:hypothetical protein
MRPRLAAAHSLSQHDLSAILEVQSKGPDREVFLSPITHFRLLPVLPTSFDLSFYRFMYEYIYSESVLYRNAICSHFLLLVQDA